MPSERRARQPLDRATPPAPRRPWSRAGAGPLQRLPSRPRGLRRGAVVALFWASTLAQAAPDAVVVERVLAVVDGTPVLSSEVQLMEALRGGGRGAALDAVIDERLMLQEAARQARAVLTPEEAETAYRSLVAGTPAAAGLPEAGLRRLARRQAAIVKYIEFRFRPQVRVSDDELRRAYEASAGARDDGAAYDARVAELREQLTRRKLDEQIETWVRELRGAADVRLTPDPEPER